MRAHSAPRNLISLYNITTAVNGSTATPEVIYEGSDCQEGKETTDEMHAVPGRVIPPPDTHIWVSREREGVDKDRKS